MKLFSRILIIILLGCSGQIFAKNQTISFAQQEKPSYITLRLNKYTDLQLEDLLFSLSLHQNKIPQHFFNSENRHLTIYYTSLIKLDDIYELVMEHIRDFDKVSGTEL